MAHATLYFPPDFLWGTATAAHQVEGQNTNSDWWAAEESGMVAHRSGQACGWLDLETALADFDRAADMGTNAHRLSLEWSRIEPEPSVFNQEAIDYYRALLEGLRARGIEPMVTLHHFSNPQWLVEKGDFQSDLIVEYFQRFARRAAEAFGDLVPKWVTINEPVVYFYHRHLLRCFPPPKAPAGWSNGLRGLRGMLVAHAAAYHAIKAVRPKAQIGVAKHWVAFEPHRPGSPLDRWWAGMLSRGFNTLWMQAMTSGRIPLLFGGGRVNGLAGSFDFVGLNYYMRRPARFLSLGLPPPAPDALMSDGGFGEIYPRGLKAAIRANLAYDRPIYITENGLPDSQDRLRPGFLITHLHQIWHAINWNFPVMGYYHWSLIDNFEWDRGWTQRFGLIEVDPETQVRAIRPSGRLYGEICRSFTLSSRMVERYAIDLMPKLFPG